MDITLRSPLDMHLHLREGDMLDLTVPMSAQHFAGAVIMPNLVVPVDSLHHLKNYRQAIESFCHQDDFRPYMTLFFKTYSRQELEECGTHILGIKLYPAGITTQSEAGVSDFSAIEETLVHMQELKIPLLVHGESDGFVLDRERQFLDVYRSLASRFPDLHIVMEHITTADAVALLDEFDNLSATVTLHHLMITLDDVLGAGAALADHRGLRTRRAIRPEQGNKVTRPKYKAKVRPNISRANAHRSAFFFPAIKRAQWK